MENNASAEFGTIENISFLYEACLNASNYKFKKAFLMLLITSVSQNKSDALDITSLVAICALYHILKNTYNENPLNGNPVISIITATQEQRSKHQTSDIDKSSISFSSMDKDIKLRLILEHDSIMIILPNNKIIIYKKDTLILKDADFLNSIMTALMFNKELQNERL